jgi:AraC family transcriptional regulator of adaptative response / DNA-3-methyladenine glycosylase II
MTPESLPADVSEQIGPDTYRVQLRYRPPCDVAGTLRFLGTRAVPGIEELADGVYRRTLRLPHGAGIVELAEEPSPQPRSLRTGSGASSPPAVEATLRVDDARDLDAARLVARRLLDLDADPLPIGEHLRNDPLLGRLVQRAPGLRVPGAASGSELAIRAVIGQQVSVAGASTLTGRLVARFGEPLARPDGRLTHLFPQPEALLEADPGSFNMPRARGETILRLCAALAAGEVVLDGSVPREEAMASLLALRGIGPWTVSYVAMRALGDRDAFLPTDLGIKHALARLGEATDPKRVSARSERWRPWRAYANFHLWASLAEGSSDVPPE